ncbi:MAG: hypothetical protein ACRCZB_03780 [Bacteroidales bacterium]
MNNKGCMFCEPETYEGRIAYGGEITKFFRVNLMKYYTPCLACAEHWRQGITLIETSLDKPYENAPPLKEFGNSEDGIARVYPTFTTLTLRPEVARLVLDNIPKNVKISKGDLIPTTSKLMQSLLQEISQHVAVMDTYLAPNTDDGSYVKRVKLSEGVILEPNQCLCFVREVPFVLKKGK